MDDPNYEFNNAKENKGQNNIYDKLIQARTPEKYKALLIYIQQRDVVNYIVCIYQAQNIKVYAIEEKEYEKKKNNSYQVKIPKQFRLNSNRR